MKIKFLIGSLLLSILILITSSLYGKEYFYIEKYNVDVSINKNSIVYIEETILAKFKEYRHGIYRFIPYKYKNHNIKIKIIDVLISKDGKYFSPEKYKIYKRNRNLIIRIGTKTKYVFDKVYYKIIYKVYNVIHENTFYWNLIGVNWPVKINNADFFISMPENIKLLKSNVSIYIGTYSSNQKYNNYSIIKNSIQNDYPIFLKPYQGITIKINFPEGSLNKIGFQLKVLFFLQENFGYFIPLFVFIIFFYIWKKWGKDEEKGTIVVRYKPPKGITPAEAGALIDDRINIKEVTATIFDLAAKGYMKISKKKVKDFLSFFKKERESLIFKKIKDADSFLKPHEKIIFDRIFSLGNEVTIEMIENKFGNTIIDFIEYLYEYLTSKQKLYTANPDKIRDLFYHIASFTLIIGISLLVFNLFSGGRIDIAIGTIISSGIIFIFSKIMPQKTFKGSKIYREILGFKEFIDKVEKDRLKKLGEENPEIFGEILPYAIAFGLEKKWVEKFEDIDISPPKWYETSDSFITTAIYLNIFNDLDFINNSLIKSASQLNLDNVNIPSGITFGGGGFSGGGFGGGGGGSW